MKNTTLRPYKTPRMFQDVVQEPAHPLVEPSLFYDPPYERPLEDEFAWHLVKYLTPISGLRYQVPVQTACANLWVDFVMEVGGRRIGFEISDLDTPTDEEEQRYRDALLLGSGALDVLYRFRAADLMYRIHDALLLAAGWDPDLFSQRGRINLNTLASPEARACPVPHHRAEARVVYAAQTVTYEDEGEVYEGSVAVPSELIVRRLSRANPGAWMHDYDAALQHFGISDDALGTQWAKSA